MIKKSTGDDFFQIHRHHPSTQIPPMANRDPEEVAQAHLPLHHHLDLLARLRVPLVLERPHLGLLGQLVQRVKGRLLRRHGHGQQRVDRCQQHHPALGAVLHHGSLRSHRQGHLESQEGVSRAPLEGRQLQAVQLPARGRHEVGVRVQEQVRQQHPAEPQRPRQERLEAAADEEPAPDVQDFRLPGGWRDPGSQGGQLPVVQLGPEPGPGEAAPAKRQPVAHPGAGREEVLDS